MSKLYAIAGERFYIGADPIEVPEGDMTVADFDAVDWIEVTGWVTMGAFGDAAALVTSDRINNKRTKKAKGTRNAGTMENVFDVVPDDEGQLQLQAAEGTDFDYPIRIVHNDAPAVGAAPTPSETLMAGLVMTTTYQGGGANDPKRMGATIEINSNLSVIPRDAGEE
jgi:hypothetical protein